MPQADANATTEDGSALTKARSKSFSNPIKTFQERRASKANLAATKATTSQPTETDAADSTPLVLSTDQSSVSATSQQEQDTFISMMRATRGMNSEEVKAFLDRKAQADHERYKNDVSGLSDSGNMNSTREKGFRYVVKGES